MDSAKFPIASSYLRRLPRGLDSYPECQAKGSVLRAGIDTAPVTLDRSALPPALAALVAAPPLPTEWFAEVHLNTIMLAYQDSVPPAVWERWTYDRNRNLLDRPLYRILFSLISPERLFTGMSGRWGTFRRGSQLSLLSKTDGVARVELRFPAYLHDENTMRAASTAMRAAGDAAGGKTQTEIEAIEATRAVIRVSWG